MRKTIKNQIPPAPVEKIDFIFSAPKVEEASDIDIPETVYTDIDEYIKSPMENAKEALDNWKSDFSVNTDEGLHIKYFDDICSEAKKFEAVDYMPDDFIWYCITTITPLADVSCFGHILHNQGTASAFAKYGYYLLGIKDNVICFALPVEKDAPNPLPHMDDCTVYIKGNNLEYCTVCVSLEPDGQYFMPIC